MTSLAVRRVLSGLVEPAEGDDILSTLQGMQAPAPDLTPADEKVIESLDRMVVPELFCVICQEEEKTVTAVCLPCEHSYHPACIEQWLRTKNTCPQCNAEIVG